MDGIPSGRDRRTEERFATPAHVDCQFASPVLEDFGKVKIVNISRSGVGLVSTEAVPAGVLLVVKLVNPLKKFSKTAIVRVIHSTLQTGGTYLVGGHFEEPLTYDELTALAL
jgi:hypothetical protein